MWSFLFEIDVPLALCLKIPFDRSGVTNSMASRLLLARLYPEMFIPATSCQLERDKSFTEGCVRSSEDKRGHSKREKKRKFLAKYRGNLFVKKF